MAIKIRVFKNVAVDAAPVVERAVRLATQGVSTISVFRAAEIEAAVKEIEKGKTWRNDGGVIILVPSATDEEIAQLHSFASHYNGASGGRAYVSVEQCDMSLP